MKLQLQFYTFYKDSTKMFFYLCKGITIASYFLALVYPNNKMYSIKNY